MQRVYDEVVGQTQNLGRGDAQNMG